MATHFTSGNWRVRAGSEDEFIKRWTEFVEWAKANAGAGRFFLIRENDDPQHFVSVGMWDRAEDVQAWMSAPEFQQAYAACTDLCEEAHGAAYSQVVGVGG